MNQLDIILNMNHEDFQKYNIEKRQSSVNKRKRTAFEDVEYNGLNAFATGNFKEGKRYVV